MAVEAIGAIGGGSQRWLDLGFMHAAAVRVDEAGHRAGAGDVLSLGAARLMGGWRALVPAGVLSAFRWRWCCQPDLGTALAIGFGGSW
jgi:rod shape determining protein RodA